jgi:DNA-binding IclR family transcriptional regulator
MNQERAGLKSALKVFTVLDVLSRNFFHGFSATELVVETGYSKSDVSRYISTLIDAGYAERIPETNRIRISHRVARIAMQVMNSLDEVDRKLIESRNRLTRY